MTARRELCEALIGAPSGSREYDAVVVAAMRRFKARQGRFDSCVVAEVVPRLRDEIARARKASGATWIDGKVVESLMKRVDALERLAFVLAVGIALLVGYQVVQLIRG